MIKLGQSRDRNKKDSFHNEHLTFRHHSRGPHLEGSVALENFDENRRYISFSVGGWTLNTLKVSLPSSEVETDVMYFLRGAMNSDIHLACPGTRFWITHPDYHLVARSRRPSGSIHIIALEGGFGGS